MKTIVEPLLEWYGKNKRDLPWRKDQDPYHVWVSEIMLQQTRVDTVIPYYHRFLAALPNVRALADAPEEQLLKLWEGLGYYSRVRNMQKAAKRIVTQYNGRFPETREELLSLEGIGPYASGAIGSIAFNKPYPAVDGNVLRVFARLYNDDTDIALPSARRKAEEIITAQMPRDRCGAYTQALMELGACICLPNGAPLCEQCPLQTACQAYALNRTQVLPVKSSAKPRKIEQKTIFVVRCGLNFALRKRPSRGLLAGLWELPWIEGKHSAEEIVACYAHILTQPPQPLGEAKHIFSHIEWHMNGFLLDIYKQAEWPNVEWFTAETIRNKLSVPTAFSAYSVAMLED